MTNYELKTCPELAEWMTNEGKGRLLRQSFPLLPVQSLCPEPSIFGVCLPKKSEEQDIALLRQEELNSFNSRQARITIEGAKEE